MNENEKDESTDTSSDQSADQPNGSENVCPPGYYWDPKLQMCVPEIPDGGEPS
jgi:hypothetical protein